MIVGGRYELLEAIGRGGAGQVYRAEDRTLGRVVAIKLLTSAAPELFERFEREARAQARLDHPHVARTYDFGSDAGVLYLVQEYLPGGSLADRVKREGRLPWREAARVAAQIARGLVAVHAAGFVHRDVKPANVLVDARGDAKLGDFGIARDLDASRLTRTGELLGSLEYLAPEQAEGSARIDARADLYALGATLHALVAGRPPFEGEGYALVKKQLTEAPPRLEDVAPGVPHELARLVRALLAKRPADRPGQAEDVARALEDLVSGRPDVRSPGRRLVVAKVVGATLVAALVLLAIVSGGALAWRASSSPPPTAAMPPPPRPGVEPVAPPQVAPPSPPVEEPRPARRRPGPEGVPNRWRAMVEGGFAPLVEVLGGAAWKARHWIRCLDASADGRVVVTGDGKGWVVTWDAATGEELSSFRAHLRPGGESSMSHAVALLADGRILSGGDAQLGLFRRDGTPVWERSWAGAKWVLVAASRDGKLALTGDESGAAVLWDLETGTNVGTFPAFDHPVYQVAVSPDGTLAWFAADTVARCVRVPSGQFVRELAPHASGVRAIAVSEDGRVVATGTEQGVVHLWDARSGAALAQLARPETDEVRSLAFSRDGARLAVAGGSSRVHVWNLAEAMTRKPAPDPLVVEHGARTWGVAFGAGDATLVVGGLDALARYDARTGKDLRTVDWHRGGTAVLAVSRDGSLLASGGGEGLRLFDLTEAARHRFVPTKSGVRALAWSPRGNELALGLDDGGLEVRDADDEANVWTGPTLHASAVTAITFLGADAGGVLSWSPLETRIGLWTRADGTGKSRTSEKRVTDVEFSPSGVRRLELRPQRSTVFGSLVSLPEVRLEGLASGAVATFVGELEIVGVDRSGRVLSYDLGAGGAAKPLASLGARPKAIAGSKEYVLVGLEKGELVLVDRQKGERGRFSIFPETVRSLACLPDGGFVVGTERGLILRFGHPTLR